MRRLILDQQRFDSLTRTLSSSPTRRDVLRGLTGAGLSAIREDCPSGCVCGNPNTEGVKVCLGSFVYPSVTCTTTDDCPRGSNCEILQSGEKLCITVCH